MPTRAARIDPRQLAKNAVTGGGRYVVTAALALAVTPYAWRVLGAEAFGVWALAGALLSVLQLVDLGLGRSLTRAVAEAAGGGDIGRAAGAVSTGRAVAWALAAVMAASGIAAGDALATGLFGVPEPWSAAAALVLAGTAVVAAIQTGFAPFQSVLEGTGRMDLANGVDTVQRVLSAAGTVLVLSAGLGLPGLVAKNAATALAAGLAMRRLAHRRAPALLARRPGLARSEARALWAFGRHVQTVNLGMAMVEPATKAILTRAGGLESVALWELAWRVAGMLSSAFLALATALFPAAAEVRAAAGTGGDAAVAALHRRALRYLAWLALPAYSVLFALAAPFVAVWLGPGHQPVARALAVLAPGWLLAVLATPAFLVAQATGRERLSTSASLITVGVGLTGVAALADVAGPVGVAAGVSVGLAAGGVAGMALFRRALALPWRSMGLPGGRELGAALLCLAVTWLLGARLPAAGWSLPLAAAAGLAGHAAVLVAGGAVGPAERAFVAGLAPGEGGRAGR